ncbi:unnamed protein product [Prorocentrum cordatum]|uniref:PAS domain-containing protein n=1 Tax=Prorocentrum cordatum TaxID=2364126 RepID=A0ABN9U564_9DINO|nr:unnamed protein product [Polarella glacialis]
MVPDGGILQRVPVNAVQPAAQVAAVVCLVLLLGKDLWNLRAGSGSCGCVANLKEFVRTLARVLRVNCARDHDVSSKRAQSKRMAIGLLVCQYAKWPLMTIPFSRLDDEGNFFLLHYTAFFIYASFVSIAPSRHGRRVQHAGYSVFMISYCLGLSPLVITSGYNPEWYIRRALWVSGTFTCYDIFLPLNILGNCMIWGSLLLTAHVHGSGACNNEDTMGTIMACFLGISAWTILCNVIFIQGVFGEMQTLTAKSELKAANSILQGTCDAVIVLDQELKVTHGEQSLANMLMMTPSKVQGESVLTLIAEEERERFAGMVRDARSSAMPGPCTAFNTSLKDSAAIPCRAEAMCVKYLQADGGNESFLIGFREAPDLPAMPFPTKFPSPAPRSGRPRPRQPPAARLAEAPSRPLGSSRGEGDLAAKDSFPDGASSSTDQSSDSDGTGTRTGCRPPVVWFDPGSIEFTLVKSSAEFRMLTGFTKEEMADLGGVLTWVRKEQRDDFAKWVRDFADSNQNRVSRHCDAVAGVKFCIECEKHRAQFEAEVHLETGWSDADSKTFKLVVHGFRAKEKTQGKTRRIERTNDDYSGSDGTSSHQGDRSVRGRRERDFVVHDSLLEVMCDVGEGDNDDDPLMITRSISPGLQLLLGTAETGQDVCYLFSTAEKDHVETWLHDAYIRRSDGGQTSAASSLWCFIAVPALEILGVALEVNLTVKFSRADTGMCLVVQRLRWSPLKRRAKARVRSVPRADGTPARLLSARLSAAGDGLASL